MDPVSRIRTAHGPTLLWYRWEFLRMFVLHMALICAFCGPSHRDTVVCPCHWMSSW